MNSVWLVICLSVFYHDGTTQVGVFGVTFCTSVFSNRKDNTLVLSAEPLAIWWIDALSEQLRVSSEALDSRKEWCICTDKPQLYTCTCGQSKQKYMEVNRGLLQDYYGSRCLRMNQTLKFEACPTGPHEKFLGRLGRRCRRKGQHAADKNGHL